MKVLGLTGSIGMGKSTAARMLKRLRVPVRDSDVTVHRLLSRGGGAVQHIEREFPRSACLTGLPPALNSSPPNSAVRSG